MSEDMKDIIIHEIRENRVEIRDCRNEINELRQKLSHLKMKVYAMAIFLGTVSAEFKATLFKFFK